MKKEKRRIINPALGEKYYYITIVYNTFNIEDTNCETNGDYTMGKVGNYFRTKAEAKKKLSEIKKLLQS